MVLLAMAREPKSTRAFVGGSDFKIYSTDLTAAKLELKEVGRHESYVTGLTLAGKVLVSCGYDRKVRWWDETGKEVRSVEAHGKWARAVVASPDGKLVASVADDMVCKVWQAESGKLVHTLKGHKEKTPNHFPSMLYAAAFSPDGKYLATGDKGGHIVVWDVATGKEKTTLDSPGMYTWDGRQRIHSIGGIRGLAFSPDGKHLAVGGVGKIGNIDHLDGPARVEVFDWQAGKRSHLFEKTKFKGIVNRMAFHPKGDWLLGAGGAGNGLFLFFDLKKSKVLREESVKFHVHAVALGEDAATLHAVGHNGAAVYEMKG
jgi:WD40 repeat protein